MDNQKFKPSCPGERFRIEYAPKVMEDGTIQLIEDGKTDLQEWYNSQADQCDMHLIVSRYLQGDMSVLEKRQGAFFDSTMIPSTYAGMLQTVIDGQRSFEALPVEIKQRFNNSFNEWFAAAGSEEWQQKMTVENRSTPSDALSSAETPPDPAIK